MEITINVKIDLSDNTLKLLSALLGGGALAVSSPKEAPVVSLPKDKVAKEKTAKEDKAATATSTPAPSTNGTAAATDGKESAETEAMRLKIRTKVVSLRDAGKKDETVKLMAQYGITQLSKLPEAQLTEFLEKLNAVK